MVDVAVAGAVGLEAVAVLASGAFTGIMWRRRSAPTARPLLVVACCLLVGSVGHPLLRHATPVRRAVAGLRSSGAGAPAWLGLVMLVVLVGGGFWFLFTLQYTGRGGGRLLSITAGGLVAYWAVVAVAGGLTRETVEAGTREVSSLELSLFVGSYLMGVVVIVGSVLVVTAALRRNALRAGEAVAFAGGGVVLALAPVVANSLQSSAAVPIMITLASGTFAVAVVEYPAFEAPPVARIAGRDRLIEEMDGPFVVVDADGQVRDLNPAAERYFDADADAARDAALDALLPTAVDPASLADARDPRLLRTQTGATLACTATRITDARDRQFGHLLVCRDVTDRQRRERRLGVLNRLLTGAVSERMDAVAEAVAPVAAADGDESDDPEPAAIGSDVHAETTRLLNLVAWTREIERSLAGGPTDPVAVVDAVREAADAVAGDGVAEVTVAESVAAVGTASVDRRLLKTVVEILVTDAVERGDGAVRIEGVDGGDGAGVRIVAQGSTVDAEASGDGARDDPLVETARQAIGHYGGRVSVETTAGARRTVVELPAASDGQRPAPTAADPSEDAAPTEPAGPREGGER